jgi:hypothetical protein
MSQACGSGAGSAGKSSTLTRMAGEGAKVEMVADMEEKEKLVGLKAVMVMVMMVATLRCGRLLRSVSWW